MGEVCWTSGRGGTSCSYSVLYQRSYVPLSIDQISLASEIRDLIQHPRLLLTWPRTAVGSISPHGMCRQRPGGSVAGIILQGLNLKCGETVRRREQ